MTDITENGEQKEKVILVGVSLSDNDDTMDSLAELEELAKTAGAVTAGVVVQNRERISPATYIGSGKVQEVRSLLESTGADSVICDDELSPAQFHNLTEQLDAKVMDRTLLILDIFARHATTSEGKLQVELAQLKYRASRLTGLGHELSRLGGGIGTRGPGESRLESDRRQIRVRISHLNKQLHELEQHRGVTREQRLRSNIPVAAVVGYTNAGKSTLLNTLTGAGVTEADMLFATLDPTTRLTELPGGQQVLITDTVGFIRKLPHNLIDAFHSTLEEAGYADIIIHVVDAANPQAEKQMHIVYETLSLLGIKDRPVITLFNKQDLVTKDQDELRDFRAARTIRVSAKYGQGLDEFTEALSELLRAQKILIDRVFAYSDAGMLSAVRTQGELLEEEYRPEGIHIRAYIPKRLYSRLT